MRQINLYQEIISRVSLDEVVTKYYHSGRKGRTNCPFHHGKDNNFCYNNEVYHCWVCGCSGNAITFVKQFFSINTDEAIRKINDDFGLHLPLGRKPTLREIRNMKDDQRQRRLELQRKAEEEKQRQAQYWSVWDEWIRLDRNKRLYRPIRPEDPWSDEFCQALCTLEYLNYLIDIIDN